MKKIILAVVFLLLSTGISLASEGIDLGSAEKIWQVWTDDSGDRSDIYISAYQEGSWSEEESISGVSVDPISPSIALDSYGIPYVVYSAHDGVSTSIYMVTLNDEGKWGEPFMLSDLDAGEDTTPTIAIDKSDNIWVSWASYDDISDDIYYKVRKEGHWNDEALLSVKDSTPDINPEIIIFADSTPCIIWSAYVGEAYRLVYSLYQSDRWSEAQLLNDSFSLGEFTPAALVEDDKVTVLWTEGSAVKNKIITKNSIVDSVVMDGSLSGSIDVLKELTPMQMQYAKIAWIDADKNVRTIPVNYINRENNSAGQMFVAAGQFFAKTNVFLAMIFQTLGFLEREAYASVDTNKYIAFGDSITYGTFSHGDSGNGGYPAKLTAKLGKTVVNRGIPGEKTASGVSRINSVLKADQAGTILLMEGTNDISSGVSTGTIIHNLGTMIDRASALGTTTILATIIPRAGGDRATQNEALNNSIRSLASSKGVALVDMEAVYSSLDEAVYYSDALHPTDAGYEVMANAWADAIGSGGDGGSDGGGGGGGGGCGTIKPKQNAFNLNVSLFLFIVLVFGLRRLAFVRQNLV